MIGSLIAEYGEARAADLAERLGVSHVTVSKRISKLKEEGLVTAQPYRSVFLTDEGRELAERARERHQLVYEFLVSLGVNSEIAEIDAEGIEHHCSAETLKAMTLVASDLRIPR